MKKLISVILVFSILNITFSGCTSSKLISVEEASQMQNSNKYLILHDQLRTFRLNNYELTDNKLKGELTKLTKKSGNNVHVYTPLNFDVKVDEKSNISIELNKTEISKITYVKNKTGATVLLVVGGLLGIIIVAGALSVNNMNIDLGPIY
jgi:hypothetical protein